MIALEHVDFSFQNRVLYRDFSFRVPPGQVCLVTGINGVGKSTLLRLMAGILKPQHGRVITHPELGARPRQKIGFISDRLSLYEHMRVEELVALHLRAFGVKTFDDHLLAHTRIEGRQRVRDLSVGQRTILHLSLVLAPRPRLLLLDEVIHDLDAYLRQVFLDEVLRLQGELGMTVVCVNVNFHDIETMLDRVVLLRDGQVLLDEPLDDLRQKVRLVATSAALPREMTWICRRDREGYAEYVLYPYQEGWAGLLQPEPVRGMNLNDIVAAFIGGQYVA